MQRVPFCLRFEVTLCSNGICLKNVFQWPDQTDLCNCNLDCFWKYLLISLDGLRDLPKWFSPFGIFRMCWEGEVAVTMSTLSLFQPVIEFPAVWKTDSGCAAAPRNWKCLKTRRLNTCRSFVALWGATNSTLGWGRKNQGFEAPTWNCNQLISASSLAPRRKFQME